MTLFFIRLIAILLAYQYSLFADESAGTPALAPGYSDLTYSLPAIGSYRLPPLGQAVDGEVLDEEGNSRSLFDLFGDKYVLLAFMYSSCSDVNGCPLTAHVFYKIKSAMRKDPLLSTQLKLISLSFDPEMDTPEVMALYGQNFRYAGKVGEWRFLTTESDNKLQPILSAYHQDIAREASDNSDSSVYSHILRVFLIDPQRQIRNIYSASFLHDQLVINDFKTVYAADSAEYVNQNATALMVRTDVTGPGDDKSGYESANYQTNSRAIILEQGLPMDLYANAITPPLGLPKLPVPKDNPITKEKIALGRKLFFDRRLSLNDTFSCAMCHVPDQGFTSNELAMAVGIEGRTVRRNSPTIYNVAYAEKLFHDGREDRLEQQIWGPLLSKNEMGNPSVGHVLNKIRAISEYDGRFESAFDGKGVSMETLGMALASYQRTLVSANSPFDRWYYGHEGDALSDAARQGFALFTGKAGCSGCHSVNETSALFVDNQLHNTGIGFRASMGIIPEKTTVTIAPGITMDIRREVIEQVGNEPPTDVGLYEVTENPFDRWKYKTPSLRNVALTAPYMHNGSLSTLEEVVSFYNQGGVENELLDPRIHPLNLNSQEQSALVAFLQSLTGDNVSAIIADAYAAPIGDIKTGDPTWVRGTDLEVK